MAPNPTQAETLAAGLTANLITALPRPGYEMDRDFVIRPAPSTSTVEEGYTISTGDREFEVLHLAGHTPGSIGIWERETGILFSGDAAYEGELYDWLPGSNPEAYVETMVRLKQLPIRTVHPGHGPSFGKARLIEIANNYLRLKADERDARR